MRGQAFVDLHRTVGSKSLHFNCLVPYQRVLSLLEVSNVFDGMFQYFVFLHFCRTFSVAGQNKDDLPKFVNIGIGQISSLLFKFRFFNFSVMVRPRDSLSVL